MIKVVEYEVDEPTDSYFSKAVARVLDEIDNGKAGVLPSSKFFDFIETLAEGFHSEYLAGHLQKLDPNESGSLYVWWFGLARSA